MASAIAERMLKCDKCGDTVQDYRGARGHVQFSSGEHGEKHEVPDGYKDWFTEVEDSTENDEDDADGGEAETPAASEGSESSDSTEDDTTQSEASHDGRGLKELLTTDVTDLFRDARR